MITSVFKIDLKMCIEVRKRLCQIYSWFIKINNCPRTFKTTEHLPRSYEYITRITRNTLKFHYYDLRL